MNLLVIHRAAKAATWERAKGELRAMVAIEGSRESTDPDIGTWQEMSHHVEEFVRKIEGEFDI